MRATIHYLAAAAVLSIYGGEVCPFLDSLTLGQLIAPILIVLAVQYGLRFPVRRWLVAPSDERHRVRNALLVELGLFVVSGLGLMMFNHLVYDFPLESGLKVVMGIATVGFFIAVDLGLEEERRLVHRLAAEGRHLELDRRYFPVSTQVALFAAVTVVMTVAVIFLVVNKDLEWLRNVGSRLTTAEAQRAMLGELAFVVAVILGYVLLDIRSYARNLRLFFDNQTGVLAAATAGDLSRAVPVGSNDEFGMIAEKTNVMIRSLKARTEEVQRTQDVTIHALASLAETRDNETGAHILRTQRYVRALARQLQKDPAYAAALDDATIDLLYKSAPLHDVGKVGIPDAILLKPGKLTDEEWVTMKTHASLGDEALAAADRELGTDSSFLRFAREIARTHHEKWDGSGYPAGLKGEEIPLSGRLMAVADVYDALISKRVYKPAFPHDKAMAILREGRAAHFDPALIDTLDAVEDEFKAIAARYGDQHTEEATA